MDAERKKSMRCIAGMVYWRREKEGERRGQKKVEYRIEYLCRKDKENLS